MMLPSGNAGFDHSSVTDVQSTVARAIEMCVFDERIPHLAFFCQLKVLTDLLPVHNIPPGSNVLRRHQTILSITILCSLLCSLHNQRKSYSVKQNTCGLSCKPQAWDLARISITSGRLFWYFR